MQRLYCDLETYSEIDLGKCGTHVYASDCAVLLFAYAVDDAPAKVWDLTTGEPMPDELRQGLNDPNVRQVWHNGANFDRTILAHAKNLRVDIPIERMDDTMVLAYSHSLPGALGALCMTLNLPVDVAKDKDGRRLILKFCKLYHGRRRDRTSDPEDWAKFVNYARLDVEAMREVWKRLPKWNWRDYDRRLFAIDRRINDRGMLIDIDFANACVELANSERYKNDQLTQQLTYGVVNSANQRDALQAYLRDKFGVDVNDMKRKTLELMLEDDDTPAEVKQLIAVRLSTAKASVSKYIKLIDATSADNRLRGCLQFRGASRTGRFAGRVFQPQNLPRPSFKQFIIDLGVEAIKGGYPEIVADPIQLMSECLRSVIVAPEGKHLVVADLSNIEGRVLAWLAGEEWKLQAFRDADQGKGADLYKLTYARTFGVRPEDVTKAQRQIGKVEELALGYRGGVGAFLTFAAGYGLNLNELAEHVKKATTPLAWAQADSSFEWFERNKLTHGLERDTFVALEVIKRGWRSAHPAIQSFWVDLEAAVAMAINGKPNKVRSLVFDKQGSWLRIRLPSGRYLCYPAARVESGGVETGCLSYYGVNQVTHKTERIHTHGGKLAENITQAVALDVLAESMPRIEDAGFEIVLSVHDEFITEADKTKTADDLCALMTEAPKWAPDLPLKAAGFTSPRYKKD